ncbi:MAG: hypothetical protein ACFCVB_03575 [Nodosilinea sp.]
MLKQVTLLVCGGMHPPSYTGQILAVIARDRELSHLSQVVCAPQHDLGVLSPFALRQVLENHLALENTFASDLGKSAAEATPAALIIWAFSAGCVGAAALASHWQRYRGRVLALFMVDGWGVPRDPGVPVHRLSHDQTTHNTSRWLGSGDEDFYADPAVTHLPLWQQPQRATGWAITPGQARQRITAAEFLCGRSLDYIDRYQRLNGG